ncbi:hypothetical protein SRHO_G00176280 [Serrasalmus rhombeus]
MCFSVYGASARPGCPCIRVMVGRHRTAGVTLTSVCNFRVHIPIPLHSVTQLLRMVVYGLQPQSIMS